MSGVVIQAFKKPPAPQAVPAPVSTTFSTVPATSISELPQEVDLVLYSGDDFSMTLTLTNPDGTIPSLVGSTAKAQIRRIAADTTIQASFICTISNNVVTLNLTGVSTQNLVGSYVWDCQLTNASGAVRTPVAGTVVFTQDVTR
jgi:hypothetical protein